MTCLILCIFYSSCLYWFTRIWCQIPDTEPSELATVPATADRLGVIVVVRNEEGQLPRLLHSLNQQLDLNFTLYLVDDNSTDRSRSLVEAYRDTAKFEIKTLKLPPLITSPKKTAIEKVVQEAGENYFLVTDGDCQPRRGWVALHRKLAEKRGVHFISGPVLYSPLKSFFHRLQHLEFLALIGTGGVSLARRQAGMCNAANMSFSRETFLAVGGYQGNRTVASGDDEFLLGKIISWNRNAALFLKSRGGAVETPPAAGWLKFYHQRKRWAGKWRYHSLTVRLKAIGVALFYLGLLLSTILGSPLLVGLAWLIKAIADWYYLRSVANSLGQPLKLVPFITLLLVYPLYVLFFAVAANWGSYTWKGRTYRQAKFSPD